MKQYTISTKRIHNAYLLLGQEEEELERMAKDFAVSLLSEEGNFQGKGFSDFKAYKENINDERMNILEIVAMITPENIHLNSFMFEPILDMSLKYLYKIYNEIKLLS